MTSNIRTALRRQYRWAQHKISQMASSGVAPRNRVKRLLLKSKQRVRQQTPALRKAVEKLVVVVPDENGETKSSSTTSTSSDVATLAQRFYEQCQTVPNILTLSRIAMAPLISHWIVTDQMNTAGLACLIAGLTDVADGMIAKQWPETQATALGTYLDPMADKILINTVALSLGWTGVLATPLVALWMTKDVALMTATYWHVKAATPHAKSVWQVIDPVTVPLQVIPTQTSKLNTGLQFATLACALYAGPCVVLTTLSWVTGTTTVLSVASYTDYSAFKPASKK